MNGAILIEIEDRVLDPERALEHCNHPSHGATDLFLGRVRDRNEGRSVRAVSYDLHPVLCGRVFEEVCREALEIWGQDIRVCLSHRRGRLEIGEISVIAAAGSPHRDQAFGACRHLIEELKKRAPIWKQEHYLDGDSEWLPGHSLHPRAHER